MSPFALLTCYICDQVKKNKKSNNKKKKKMHQFIKILPALACGCILPIFAIWMGVRKEMNEANTRMQIVLAAIEKNPDMDLEELMKKISPKKKLLKEKLLTKLLWGGIIAFLGIGLIGFCTVQGYIGGMNSTDLQVFILAGVVLSGVGIAFLVNYFVGKKMLAKEMEAEQKKLLEQA